MKYQKTIKSEKPALLIGGSKFDINILNKISKNYPIYAADGGANVLIKNNINFKAVVGDMDSIEKKILLNSKFNTIPIFDQNTTDLQKCLNIIDAPFIIGIGFLNQRLDHSLASLNAISSNHSFEKIILIGDFDVIIWKDGYWSCNLPVKSRVSIFPLGYQEFEKSTGLLWPLDNLVMEPSKTIGTSNETYLENFSILPSRKKRANYVTLLSIKNLSTILDYMT